MAVQFRCRECETPLKAPDKARGKVMTCKSCGTKNKVPAGGGAKPAKKGAPKKPRSETDFLSGPLDAEDRSVTVCQECGEQYQGDDPVCPYCGFDQEAGQLTKEAKRRELRKKGRLDPSEYFEIAKKDGLTYLFNQVPFAMKSGGLYVLLPGLLAVASAMMVIYNGRTPPKIFWGFLTFVFAMGAIGWLLTLSQIVVRATIAGQEKLKRVHYGFFQSAADGISLLALQVAYLVPISLAMVGAYLYSEDNHVLGIALCLLGPVLMMPFYPVIFAHLSMPVSSPAWIFTKTLGIFGKVAGAAFYWAGFTTLAMLPAIIGVGVMVGVFGSDITEVTENLDFNAKLAYEKYLAELGKADEPPEAVEPKEVDLTLLIGPGIITTFSLFYVGFVWLYPARILGLMALYFKRPLELIEEKAEKKYVPKKRRGKAEEEV